MNHRIALLAILVAGLVLPAPLALAHGNQFLCARVTIGDDGLVALELTADYGDNPNIADAVEARQVLRDCLRLVSAERTWSLEQLAPLQFVERDHYSADSPVPPTADPGPHRLVVASWQARLPGQQVVFVAKQRTPLDVVLWRADDQRAADQSRWILLIAGERSPPFILTPTATSGLMVVALGVVLVIPLLVVFLRRFVRRMPLSPTGKPD